jgi:hypothetical protein
MKFFETKTQYSSDYNDIWLNFPQAKKGLACPYFSIISAYKFLKSGKADKDTHEMCLLASVSYSALIGSYNELTFAETLGLTDLKVADILATTTELVAEGILGFPEMIVPELPTDDKRHVTIFLKNAKYFVVLVDKNGYYVRDCHESFQYDFSNFTELVNFVSSVYQFGETINVTGLTYSDYSSIEFLKVSNPFKTDILSLIGMDDANINLHKLDIEGIEGYIELNDKITTFPDNGDGSIFSGSITSTTVMNTVLETAPDINLMSHQANGDGFVDFE